MYSSNMLFLFFIVGSLVTVSSKNSVARVQDVSASREVQPPPTANAPTSESTKGSSSSSAATGEDSTSSTSSAEENHFPNKLRRDFSLLKCGVIETRSKCLDLCDRKSREIDEWIKKCIKSNETKKCVKGCRCADNYYHTRDGRCVLKEDCPKCHKADEIYEECPKTCPPQTCESLWSTRHCPIQPAVCKPACQCKPMMYRNLIGECISREDCMKCRRPNEYFSCGVPCDNECATLSKQNITNCPITTDKICTKKCYCKPGYARDVDGHCIPISACPAECKEHEEYVKNTRAINRPRTCSEFLLGLMPYQVDDVVIPGCTCVAGYVRNHKDICIPQKECYSDVTHANSLDANLTEIVAITTITLLAPTPSVCGVNEVMSNCINSGCGKQECDQLGKIEKCVYVPSNLCKRGCKCKVGYLRDSNGKCIPIADCPNKACEGDNEVFDVCPNRCITESCFPMSSKRHCPPPRVCRPSCRCKPNTCRNDQYQCVTPENSCKKNERYIRNLREYTKPITCKDVRLQEINAYNSSINSKRYVGRPTGCVCAHGYVRNDDDLCIPIKDCPPLCRSNEVYVKDKNRVCRPLKCTGLGFKIKCKEGDDQSEASDDKAIPSCICREGYARDAHGICVPTNQCSSCAGDPNATGGCGVYCKTCENLKDGPKRCPKICIPNGCQCKRGYVYNKKSSKCVLPEECDEYQIPLISSEVMI